MAEGGELEDRLAERDHEPVDLRLAQAQDHGAGTCFRVRLPRVVRDDEVIARLTGSQEHYLVVWRLVCVCATDRLLAPERTHGNALEGELRILGELLEHRSVVARADSFVEPL